MNFLSDNQTGASVQVLEMLGAANSGATPGYGSDAWTARAVEQLREVFDCDLNAYFVATGTAANSLALACIAQPWETVICHRLAHLYIDESTAPEHFSGGTRPIPLGDGSGKLDAATVRNYLANVGKFPPHNARTAALSVTQANEMGLVYTLDEIRELTSAAREHNLRMHMDGARFANAVAAIGCTPAELSWKAGIDVLCLGATKCGALCAEAVIFFDKSLAATFEHRQKCSGHLVSKGRLFGAQFCGWLEDGHWLELALRANAMMQSLQHALADISAIRPVWPADANQLFAIMPRDLFARLQEKGAQFYDWFPGALPPTTPCAPNEVPVRLVTSFATTQQEIDEFRATILRLL